MYQPGTVLDGMRVDLGSTQLGIVDAAGVAWRIATLEGWDSPEVRTQLSQREADHGAWMGPTYFGERPITLTGTITAPNAGSLDVAVEQILAACALTDTTLTVWETIPKAVTVRRSGKPIVQRVTDKIATYSLLVTAPDPRRYEIAQQTGTAALPATVGGLVPPLTPPLTIAAATNLVLNPSLEVDLSNTQAYGPSITLAQVTTDAYVGSACVQVTHTAASQAGVTWSILPESGAGTPVAQGIWVKVPASGVTSGILTWRNGTTTLHTAAITVPPAGTWTRLTGSYTLGQGETCDRIGLALNCASGTVWWSDAAMAVPGTLSDYGDGDTPGWEWTGTPRASTSAQVSTVTGQIVATNSGTIGTRPTYTITGPVDRPRIAMAHANGTVQVLAYSDSIGDGDTLVIDTDRHTVTLNGAASRRRYLSGPWPEIAPGETVTVQYLADGAYNASTMLTASWRSAWL